MTIELLDFKRLDFSNGQRPSRSAAAYEDVSHHEKRPGADTQDGKNHPREDVRSIHKMFISPQEKQKSDFVLAASEKGLYLVHVRPL